MYVVQDRKTEQLFLAKLSTKSAATTYLTKTAISLFRDFCEKTYSQTPDQVFDTIEALEPVKREPVVYDVLQSFVNFTDSRKVQPITVKSYFKMLKPYIAYRTGIKIHSEDVNENIKFRRLIKKKGYIPSHEQINAILPLVSNRRKALYLTMLSSGISIGEACQITKKDIIPGARYKIHVPAEYRKVKIEKTTYISKEAEKYTIPLLEELGPDDLVYVNNHNVKSAAAGEANYFSKVRKEASITAKAENGRNKITLHTFRSFFITKGEKINAGLGHALAGHERYMVVYERYSEQELVEFYLKLEPELTFQKQLTQPVAQQVQPQMVSSSPNEVEELKKELEKTRLEKQQYQDEIKKILAEKVLELIPTQLELSQPMYLPKL